jgi:multisubunit Na+/H+ antiporter MnhG subunit
MRLFLYLCLLVSGSIAIAAFIHQTISVFTQFPIALKVGRYLPYVIIAMRAFVWFKRRKVQAPSSFAGLPYVATVVGVSLVAVAAFASGVLHFLNIDRFLSSFLVILLLMLFAPVAAVSLFAVEYRDYRMFAASQKSNE